MRLEEVFRQNLLHLGKTGQHRCFCISKNEHSANRRRIRTGQQAVELKVVVIGVEKQRTTTSDDGQSFCSWLGVEAVAFLAFTTTSGAVRG